MTFFVVASGFNCGLLHLLDQAAFRPRQSLEGRYGPGPRQYRRAATRVDHAEQVFLARLVSLVLVQRQLGSMT